MHARGQDSSRSHNGTALNLWANFVPCQVNYSHTDSSMVIIILISILQYCLHNQQWTLKIKKSRMVMDYNLNNLNEHVWQEGTGSDHYFSIRNCRF